MPDLFPSLGPSTFPWAVGGAIVAFLAMALIQAYYGRRLKTAAARRRIVALELAGTEQRTRDILTSGQKVPGAIADATRGLYWVFGSLVMYAAVLSHLCVWAERPVAAAWNWPVAAGTGVLLA